MGTGIVNVLIMVKILCSVHYTVVDWPQNGMCVEEVHQCFKTQLNKTEPTPMEKRVGMRTVGARFLKRKLEACLAATKVRIHEKERIGYFSRMKKGQMISLKKRALKKGRGHRKIASQKNQRWKTKGAYRLDRALKLLHK